MMLVGTPLTRSFTVPRIGSQRNLGQDAQAYSNRGAGNETGATSPLVTPNRPHQTHPLGLTIRPVGGQEYIPNRLSRQS